MALTARITLTGPPAESPEDYLSSALGVIFPDDVMNQHGDAEHGLLYTSPHLPKPLHISLSDPVAEDDRRLFSHYLWNASLLLAELIEAGTLGLPQEGSAPTGGRSSSPPIAVVGGQGKRLCEPLSDFSITGLSTLELGAGTALPSLLCALLGARRVVVSDYPSDPVLANLRANVARNVQPERSPLGEATSTEVTGHEWGDFKSPSTEVAGHRLDASMLRGAFDRVLVADCLWMPWQHDPLRRSIAWFLRDDDNARAWVVAGFHTGRAKMRGFFDGEALAAVGLEVERMWERDCDGWEREWAWDRGGEDTDMGVRKRWLVVAVLRRLRGS
ncbi:hypothetical protein VTK73DRAFT_8188 [Phialemonium thermophilum]|uniref:Nicotinamide N-methyltransferase n=1 Tax=Phialemonium thermophilum TaxID=223376 RepID=A0ABR3XR13_9PEZI